jgi:hypothetical protein
MTFDRARFEEAIAGGRHLLRLTGVRRALEGIFALALPERERLAEAFEHDIGFADHRDDPEFVFAFRQLPAPTRDAGKRLMVSLYEDVLCGRGFSGLPGQRVDPFDINAFEASYRVSNPTTTVCPACLGFLLPPIRNVTLVDREHYFPKALYPPLAVHPWNLVLTCITCNQRAHGSADPLEEHLPGALTEVYLPYARPGMDDVSVSFSPGSVSVVEIASAAESDSSRRRIRNFDRLYKIQEQWSGRLTTYWHDAVVQDLAGRVTSISPGAVRQELEIMARVLERQTTTAPDAFLRLRYIEWLLEHLDLTVRHVRAAVEGTSGGAMSAAG